jgi:hypothetical protein
LRYDFSELSCVGKGLEMGVPRFKNYVLVYFTDHKAHRIKFPLDALCGHTPFLDKLCKLDGLRKGSALITVLHGKYNTASFSTLTCDK